MTTYDYSEPTIGQVILRKIARRMEVKRDRQSLGVTATRVNTRLQAFVRLVLTIAGFALLTIAAFTVYTAAGFVMAGLSCFVLAWLATPSGNNGQAANGG